MSRDREQVVSSYTGRTTRDQDVDSAQSQHPAPKVEDDHQILMVDQLWLWVLDEGIDTLSKIQARKLTSSFRYYHYQLSPEIV